MIIDSGEEWTFEKIEEIYENIKRIADDKFGLNYFPNQLEIISSEQMLDAYASVGMPVYYPHWSFGEQFVHRQNDQTDHDNDAQLGNGVPAVPVYQ